MCRPDNSGSDENPADVDVKLSTAPDPTGAQGQDVYTQG